MRDNKNSLDKNQTLELVPKANDKLKVGYKWVYKVNEGITKSESVRYNIRLVAKRYTHKKGINYNEIFHPLLSIPLLESCFHLLLIIT